MNSNLLEERQLKLKISIRFSTNPRMKFYELDSSNIIAAESRIILVQGSKHYVKRLLAIFHSPYFFRVPFYTAAIWVDKILSTSRLKLLLMLVNRNLPLPQKINKINLIWTAAS